MRERDRRPGSKGEARKRVERRPGRGNDAVGAARVAQRASRTRQRRTVAPTRRPYAPSATQHLGERCRRCRAPAPTRRRLAHRPTRGGTQPDGGPCSPPVELAPAPRLVDRQAGRGAARAPRSRTRRRRTAHPHGCAIVRGQPPCDRRRRPRPDRVRRSTPARRAGRARIARRGPRSPPCPPPDLPARATHHCPTHSAATETSYDHNGSSRGTHASIQRWLPGSRYTAPPPPRRRTSSTERSRRTRGATSSGGCVLPRTSVGCATARGTTVRRGSARKGSTSKRGCEGEAEEDEEGRTRPSLRTPQPDTAPTTDRRPRGAGGARGARRAARA